MCTSGDFTKIKWLIMIRNLAGATVIFHLYAFYSSWVGLAYYLKAKIQTNDKIITQLMWFQQKHTALLTATLHPYFSLLAWLYCNIYCCKKFHHRFHVNYELGWCEIRKDNAINDFTVYNSNHFVVSSSFETGFKFRALSISSICSKDFEYTIHVF